jgi:hypothetical protein
MKAIAKITICVSLILNFTSCSSPKLEADNFQSAQNQIPSNKISEEKVRYFLNLWEKSQDSKDYSAYENCYSVDFIGVKRVGNKTIKLNFADWIKDRRKMMSEADNLDVDIENLKITIDKDAATAQFTQHYRSRQYADFGQKIMNIKLVNSELKISFEELGFSTKIHD